MAEVKEIKTKSEFDEALDNAPGNLLVALNFHTPWAEPCKLMNEVFKTLAANTTNDKTLFLSIDADELPEISEPYDVTAVPYFVLLKNKDVLKRISGADPKELGSAIEKYSGVSGLSIPPPLTTAAPPPAAAANGGSGEPAVDEVEEDITTRLGKLVKAAPVMLFMKGTPAAPQCGFSRQLVALLREKGVRYGFFNILADDEVRQGLKTFSDWPTYPQLYLDGDLVGGLDIVRHEFDSDPDFMKDKTVHAQK